MNDTFGRKQCWREPRKVRIVKGRDYGGLGRVIQIGDGAWEGCKIWSAVSNNIYKALIRKLYFRGIVSGFSDHIIAQIFRALVISLSSAQKSKIFS
jgi:hypothetical protein